MQPGYAANVDLGTFARCRTKNTRRLCFAGANFYFSFAVLTLAVRSFMSPVQSARRVSKADGGSTSSSARRSMLEMSAGEFMS